MRAPIDLRALLPPATPDRRARMFVVAASALALGGCLERGLIAQCPPSPPGPTIRVTSVDAVDLLFLIDNSNSMAEEQASLIAELPRLVRVLSTGDRDEDGARDFDPVRSLHVGVVSSDLGAGPYTGVPTCARGLGDDGILRSRSRLTTAPCMASYPSGVFEFERDVEDAAAFASEVVCVVNLGTGGCGFEQQLEASLKALTPISPQTWTRPGYTPPRFVGADGVPDAIAGNADGPNMGFLRPESALAIVLVTDEEDCSVRDYGLFASDDARFAAVPLNQRCHRFSDPAMGLVHPVQRYVDGFLGLRRDPERLVFHGIVGISPEQESAVGVPPDFDAILASSSSSLEPACSTTNGVAYPPFRIVETAAGLSAAGARVSLSSICAEDFGRAIDGVLTSIVRALGGATCLAARLERDAEGRVDCELFELLPEMGRAGVVTDCTRLAGRELHETVTRPGEGPRQLCRVSQVLRTDIASHAGWYYDDFSDEVTETCAVPARIAFTGLGGPTAGADVHLECADGPFRDHTDVTCDADNDDGPTACSPGMFCDLAADRCSTGRSLPDPGSAPLTCDPVGRRCAVPCIADVDCAATVGLDHGCDLRTNALAAGESVEEVPSDLRERVRGICVPTTCL